MTEHRIINPEDARTALVDAITDVCHVLEAELEEPDASAPYVVERLIHDEIETALYSAFHTHYLAERDGGDDLTSVEVVGYEDPDADTQEEIDATREEIERKYEEAQ